MSIKGKLNRFKSHIVKDDSSHPPPKLADKGKEIPYLDKWQSFGVKPFFFDDTYCFVRTVEYPLEYEHGLYSFEKLVQVVKMWNESNISHPLSAKSHSPSDLFFFDTETTGLGGGVGNTIFLLGHARVEQNRIVLTQHFLPDPGSEVALYQSFLSSVDYTTLVTYNGKSFDWPQVKTRHTLIRDALPRLPEFGHFDLYHAARRLWKSKLDSVRLVNVEKEILGITRENDVPGYLAPILYFDFLERRDPDGIFGILQHNEIDILSLITLYIHLSGVVLLSQESLVVSEQYEVARWLESLGETNVAQQLYEQVAEAETEEEVKAKLALAFLYKKQMRISDSIGLFQEVFEGSCTQLKVISGIELAKYYEHKAKDFPTAIKYTSSSYEVWRNININLAKENEERELRKRLLRLEGKLRNNKKIFPG